MQPLKKTERKTKLTAHHPKKNKNKEQQKIIFGNARGQTTYINKKQENDMTP